MKGHIGEKVKEMMYEKRMKTRDLAVKLGITPQGLYYLLRKGTWPARHIEPLSKILDHDFGQYYQSEQFQKAPEVDPAEHEQLKKEVEELRRENAHLKEKTEMLSELNRLLKEKK